MTVVEWLRERAPDAPRELLDRLEHVLGARGAGDAAQAPGVCIEAADELLRGLVASPGAGRECALDLLTADALVTHAFEAGASRDGWIPAHAAEAMARFAAAARPS